MCWVSSWAKPACGSVLPASRLVPAGRQQPAAPLLSSRAGGGPGVWRGGVLSAARPACPPDRAAQGERRRLLRRGAVLPLHKRRFAPSPPPLCRTVRPRRKACSGAHASAARLAAAAAAAGPGAQPQRAAPAGLDTNTPNPRLSCSLLFRRSCVPASLGYSSRGSVVSVC